MTWNILAERLVTQSHFPYVQSSYLDYRYRIDITVIVTLIQKRLIERMDCAILALQEVDPTNSFFDFLKCMGYDYHFRPKGCFQGILIAYKRDQFKLIQSRVIDYDKMISPRCKRFPYTTGHGALLLKVAYV
jgi:mRNA deadenylase 3'-5' endonuclease subunit Ccr4